MIRRNALSAVALSAAMLAGCAQDAAEHPQFRQVPVVAQGWAVYSWTLVDHGSAHWGSVVVRGMDTDPIPGMPHEQGAETWSLHGSAATRAAPAFSLRLMVAGDAEDAALVEMVAATLEYETELGSTSSVPAWSEGATPTASETVFTLTECDGPEQCEDSDALFSLFSAEQDEFELFEGDTIVMSPVSAREDGYPDSTWFTVEP